MTPNRHKPSANNCLFTTGVFCLLAFTLFIPMAWCQTSAYHWMNFAGQPGGSGVADGEGSAARFRAPEGVAVDIDGSIYVADGHNYTIRKITSDGTVTTFAGSAGNSGTADGLGIAARFSYPQAVTVDGSGNIFVADMHAIRKITREGAVTTFAGAATSSGTADGLGNTARFYTPEGVAVDGNGNVFVADTGNHTIRKITGDGRVTTMAGAAGMSGMVDGAASAARFYNPAGVTVDGTGNIFVTDRSNYRVRKISASGVVTTLAGAWPSGSADGTGTSARFNGLRGVSADRSGNVYVADTYNDTIRKINNTGVVTTLAGSAGLYNSVDGVGSAARFYYPSGVVADGNGNVYVADTNNHTIRKISSSGDVITIAGLAGGNADGTGNAARFYCPEGVAVDGNGNVFVVDTRNHTIRKITVNGEVTTLAGTATMFGSFDGSGAAARFQYPSGVSVDTGGNVFVADTYNSTIRKVTPAGIVTTLAGKAGYSGFTDGRGAAASFRFPNGLAVDSNGYVYVADTTNRAVRKISSGGVTTTMASGLYANSVAVDDCGNVFVANYWMNSIQRICTCGAITTLAGGNSEWSEGSADGQGDLARFNNPRGVATDHYGNVYVADTWNHTIRKIDSSGVVRTIGGTAGVIGNADGIGAFAGFNYPNAICVANAGELFVADTSSNRVSRGTLTEAGSAPAVGTPTSTSVTATSVTLAGIVTSGGGLPIIECGVIVSATATNSNPVMGCTCVTKVATNGTSGTFALPVNGLSANTSYSFKAYATNQFGTSYTPVATFTTLSAAEGLSHWASVQGLIGNDALPTATPFGDGVSNLLKYAFNLNADRPDSHRMPMGGASGLPHGAAVQTDGQSAWRLEYVRRKGAGLIYTPKKSSTLEPSSFVPMTIPETVFGIDTEWERVVIEEPYDPATTSRLFSILEVSLP